jgi:hypothetical protein
MRGVFRQGVKSKRLLRPLIGVIVAYAVAAQSLLIALGGFSRPANVGDDAPAFEFVCTTPGEHRSCRPGSPAADNPSSMAAHAFCRHTPKVGAACGNSARARGMTRLVLAL